MAFNEDTSFIEYPVDQPTQDFVTNFDTIGGTTDVVLVTVDGVLTDTPESSYTVQQINHTTWRVTPEVQIGSVVRLYRVTDIDEMMHVFTAGAKFIARNMDNNFKQIRHSQQEVRDAFDFLEGNTLGVVEAAKSATVLANTAAQTASAAAAQVDDKIAEIQPELDSKLQEFELALNTIVVDGGVPALAVSTASGENQQSINDYNGVKWRSRVGGYDLNARVVLDNGDIVKSTVAGNTIDPNADMTGWEFDGLSKSIYNPLNLNYTQQQLATAFTTSLNALIQKVSLSGGGTISIPDGQFQVDLSTSIILKDNIELRLGRDTHLIAAPHNLTNYELIEIHGVSNVKLTGGKIDGNKSQNSATTGEWGMGVSIRAATNVHVDTEVVDCWGDGIYIGRSSEKAYSENVHIPKLRTSGNRRQGVSVVSVKGLTGDVWNISEISGTNPQDGVDFEPNYPDEFLLGVSINTIIAKNVTGSGVEFNLSKFKESELGVNRVDVNIGNIVVDGAGAQGFVCYASTSSNAKGLIKVGKITTSGVVGQDFVVNNWNADSIKVHVTDLFANPTANKTSVSLVRKTTGFDTGGAVGGCSVDNVHINYPETIPAPTTSPIDIHIATLQLDDVKNVTLGKISTNRNVDPVRVSFNVLDNVGIPKLSKIYSTNVELTSATTEGRYLANFYEYVSQQSASFPNPFFTVAEINKGHKFKITGGSANGARLRFNSNITVEGFNNNGENKTYTIPFGASVEFEATDLNTVRILSESPNVVNPFTSGSFTLASDLTIPANGSTLISVPFYNKMTGKSYIASMSASIIGLIDQVYSTTSLNAITVRIYNLTSASLTLPLGTVVSVARV